jgi:hypothetical protein
MTPERWQQIEHVYLAALECDAKKRRVFLKQTCGDDIALREEVESLLSHEPEAAEFLERPGTNLRTGAPRRVLPRGVEYLLSKRLLQVVIVLPVVLLAFSIVENRHRTIADLIRLDAGYLYWIAAAILIFKRRNQIRTWLERNFFP